MLSNSRTRKPDDCTLRRNEATLPAAKTFSRTALTSPKRSLSCTGIIACSNIRLASPLLLEFAQNATRARLHLLPWNLERETGIEPATNSLEGCDSTTELLPPNKRSCRVERRDTRSLAY